MEFEVKQITQEEIDKQNADKENGQPLFVDERLLLRNVKAGDYVSNGELLVGRDYVEFLLSFIPDLPDEEKEELSALVIQLDKLNKKV
jgi:tRNA(Phe) wybutosine-synthesizing methylase Tyw3